MELALAAQHELKALLNKLPASNVDDQCQAMLMSVSPLNTATSASPAVGSGCADTPHVGVGRQCHIQKRQGSNRYVVSKFKTTILATHVTFPSRNVKTAEFF